MSYRTTRSTKPGYAPKHTPYFCRAKMRGKDIRHSLTTGALATSRATCAVLLSGTVLLALRGAPRHFSAAHVTLSRD